MRKGYIIIIIGIFFIFYRNDICVANNIALVIGNSAYQDAPLQNPVNDANALTQALTTIGFSVTKKINATQQDMEDAIREFSKNVRPNDVALFYFSGHGLQIDGTNYLLPIGSSVDSADEIKYKAVAADLLLDKLEDTGSQLNILILDACRNNPFKRFRSIEKGLAMMSAPTGTFIAYATAPGTVAYDGDGENSPYTTHLLKKMMTPGVEIEKLFKQVRVAVMADTGGKQVPWESSSLTGDFYFMTPPSSVAATPVPITDDLLTMFFRKSLDNPKGGTWVAGGDDETGGNSFYRLDMERLQTDGILHLDYQLHKKYEYPYVYVQSYFNKVVDFSAYSKLEIKLRGSGAKLHISIRTEKVQDYSYHKYVIDKSPTSWKIYQIPFSSFVQPSWGKPVKFNSSRVFFVEVGTDSSQDNEQGWFEIEYIKLVK